MSKVIITGGTGLAGRRLTELLTGKGYLVNILSRDPQKANEFKWDISKGIIDEKVFEGATAIIHLAGAGVADKRWTEERKKEILESRSESTRLLYACLSKRKHSVQTFLSASAAGYYGDRKNELLTESSLNGTGFLPEVCKVWEEEAEKMGSLNIRVCKVRIGIVLSKDGGALPKLEFPMRMGIGAYIGNGKQFVPWIHIDDLCGIFIHLLENNSISGVFNACAPDKKTNKEMSRSIAHALHRPFIPFPAPQFIIQTVLGEMATMLLMSTNCSSEKITLTGFHFRFPALQDALRNLSSKS